MTHTFKMAAMTSFHAEKCCLLVSAHKSYARRLWSAVRQFLIYSAVEKIVTAFESYTVAVLCWDQGGTPQILPSPQSFNWFYGNFA